MIVINRNKALSFFLLLMLCGSCKKQECYLCTSQQYINYWVKGTDTVKVISRFGALLPGLIDSGYNVAYVQKSGPDISLTICDVTIDDFRTSDSCHLIK